MIPRSINKSKIPHAPGVYIFKDLSGQILYIGKAIDLYHRVSSYFSTSYSSKDIKTSTLIAKIAEYEIIKVSSEIEALILEANLIKKYLPLYNIKLTDDKGYLYIKITREPFPKILTARKKDLKGAKKYFGPFPSTKTVQSTLKKLRRIFPWCSGSIKKDRACFYYHIGLCLGPCVGKINKSDYNRLINQFSKFMEGKKADLVKDLTAEMINYSRCQEFEKAQSVKKTIDGIKYLTQANSVDVYLENPNFIQEQNKLSLIQLKNDLKLPKIPERIECYDISNIRGKFATGSLVVLTFGEIDKKWYRKFKVQSIGKPNDVGMMQEIVRRRLKHKEWPMPNLILVDGGRGQVGVVRREITESGMNIPVFGLAKKLEWLYTSNKEIVKLEKTSLSLKLMQKIRDEAHCFAIRYHQKLREKQTLSVV